MFSRIRGEGHKLLEYFVYLESYKKYHPNERGELTRTIITIFGYKGKIVYYFAECMDDPKFNISRLLKNGFDQDDFRYIGVRSCFGGMMPASLSSHPLLTWGKLSVT